MYNLRSERYKAEVERLAALQGDLSGPVQAFTIQIPADAPLVRQLEQDPTVLFEGAANGAAAVYRALTGQEKLCAGLTVCC